MLLIHHYIVNLLKKGSSAGVCVLKTLLKISRMRKKNCSMSYVFVRVCDFFFMVLRLGKKN